MKKMPEKNDSGKRKPAEKPSERKHSGKKPSVNPVTVLAILFVVLIATGGGGIWIYASPKSYVSLQSSTEVNYTLNQFDIVLKAEVSGEGSQVLEEKIQKAGIHNKKIQDALLMTLDVITEYSVSSEPLAKDLEGTLDIRNMVVTVSCENQEKQKTLTKDLNLLLLAYGGQPESQESGIAEDSVEEVSDTAENKMGKEPGEEKKTDRKPSGALEKTNETETEEETNGKWGTESQVEEQKTDIIEESLTSETFDNPRSDSVESSVSHLETKAFDKQESETEKSLPEETRNETKISPSDSLEFQAETSQADRAREKLESQAAKIQSKQESQEEKIKKKTGR